MPDKKKILILNIVSKTFFLLILLFVTLLPTQAIQALNIETQEAFSATYTLKDFSYTTDQEFLGALVDHTYDITLPSNWQFESDSILNVHFSHSSALDPVSSMSVDWNGQRVGSTLLTADNVQNGTLQVILPPEVISSGYNTLQIQFFMGMSEDFCLDFDNPAVWAVVHKSTSLQLSYQQVLPHPELNSAMDILIDSSPIASNEITMIIPDEPDLQSVNALAIITARLGQLADWRNIAINPMTLTEAAAASPPGNLVILATFEQITNFDSRFNSVIASALETTTNGSAGNSPLSEDDGLITFQQSSFDPASFALILTGTNTTAVEKAARAAARDELFEQSEGQWMIIRSVSESPYHAAADQLSVSMEDLGMDDTAAYGTYEQTIQFNFPLSALWDIDTEAWLELHFSHSELLNADRSTLNVMVNDIPISSIELSSNTANDALERIRIPLRFLKIGDNTFTIKANMEYSDSRDQTIQFCTDDTYPRAWLTIHADTAIILPELPQELDLNLKAFPYGFADPFSFKKFAFVLPNGGEKDSVEILTDLALTLGKALKGDPGDIEVIYTTDSLSQDAAFEYYLHIGTMPNLLSETINNALPLPLDISTGLPQSNDLILELDSGTGIRSYIQTYRQDDKINLVITALTPEGLGMAGKLLSDSTARSGLDGNVAVVTDAGNAGVYQIESEDESAEQADTSASQTTILNLPGQSIWVIRISIGVAVISIVAIIAALVWKNRRTRET